VLEKEHSMRKFPGPITAAVFAVLFSATSLAGPASKPSAGDPKPSTSDPKPVAAHAPHASTAGMPAEQALQLLIDGNQRWAEATPFGPHRDEDRRAEVFGGQHPYAAILTCADSRVPPELLFDAGVGDLFVVRVAGNVAGRSELGTLEYGVEHLGVSLVVVLGHSRCGAVKAAVEGAEAAGALGDLVEEIAPAAAEARRSVTGPAMLNAAIRANARATATNLVSRSPVIAAAVESGKCKVVAGVYNLQSGTISWLDPVPTSEATPSPAELLAPARQPKPQASARHDNPADNHKTAADDHSQKADAHDGKPDAHGAKADPHAKPDAHASSDAHDKTDAHDTADGDRKSAAKPTATAQPKENWMMLGAFTAGGLGLGIGVISLISRKKAA
jgi:carbonic anhydrase